jgi:hypothetical protein
MNLIASSKSNPCILFFVTTAKHDFLLYIATLAPYFFCNFHFHLMLLNMHQRTQTGSALEKWFVNA